MIAAVSLLFALAAPVSAQELPGSYDPRPDMASGIRDQQWGTCWVTGGISTLESYLIKTGSAGPDIDLSEEDVLWWTNGNYYDPDPENHYGGFGWTNTSRNDGGYAAMTTGYLSVVGARAESDIPYLGMSGDEEEDLYNEFYHSGKNVRPENYYTAPVAYEVTDIVFFDENSSAEDYKRAILDYGAVTASYYDGGAEYLNEETASYWYPGGTMEFGNHTISVVGWDDDYPKENFTLADGRMPEGNGAWLIKNSYGTDYGAEGGYTWISYEDAILFEDVEYNQKYSVAGARVPEERKAYYWDEYGAVTSYYPEADGEFTCANVYEFGSGETLTEIMFMTWSKGAEYELYYTPVKNNAPVSDTSKWTLIADGTVDHAGYTTIEAENKVELAGGKGAVVLTLRGNDLNIGTDEPLLEMGRAMFNFKLQPDVSFFLDGGGFKSAEHDAVGMDGTPYQQKVNLSLRAYTTETPQPTASPTPTAEHTASPTPTAEPTASPTHTAGPTASPDPTETPQPTESPAPTQTPEATVTAEPTQPADDGSEDKPSETPAGEPEITPSGQPSGTPQASESSAASAQTGDANAAGLFTAVLACALTVLTTLIIRKNKS